MCPHTMYWSVKLAVHMLCVCAECHVGNMWQMLTKQCEIIARINKITTASCFYYHIICLLCSRFNKKINVVQLFVRWLPLAMSCQHELMYLYTAIVLFLSQGKKRITILIYMYSEHIEYKLAVKSKNACDNLIVNNMN